MATPPTLDFAKLLSPIAGESPAGVDVRSGARDPKDNQTSLEKVRAFRDAAKLAEDPNRVENEGKHPSLVAAEWDDVLQCSTDAVAAESKDLRLISPLIEALVRKHGIAGLRDGFKLTRELAEQFWDSIYPRPDAEEEDGIAVTVAPLDGLFDGPLAKALEKIPVTNAASQAQFVVWQHKRAPDFDAEPDPAKRATKTKIGCVSMATISKAILETPKQFYEDLLDDFGDCQREFVQLESLLDAKCGANAAPPTSALKEALADTERRIAVIAKQIGVDRSKAEEVPTDEAGGPTNGQPGASSAKTGGRTRDDALKDLLEIASFFERTEPHSPIPLVLRQAERWGKMSLPDLLKELIADGNVVKALFKQMGVPPEAS